MPHSVCRAAFGSGKNSTNALLALYCSLVNMEIALKDRAAPWKGGHKVGEWLAAEGDPGLISLSVQLTDACASMKITSISGGSVSMNVNSYPEMRYLRHTNDFPGETTDAQLATCLALVRDIEVVLIQKGVL